MTHALDTSGLQALYSAGHSLVVPHTHAARTLGARLRASAPVPDSTSPQPRSPIAWHEWTACLWTELVLEGADDRLLLNRLQEEALWAEILAAHPPHGNPAARRDLASLARAALQRAAGHRILERLRSDADSPDSRNFITVLDAFHTHCNRHRLLPSALLEEALAAHLVSGTLRPPGTLHLIGFEHETPAQQHLVATLKTAGTSVQSYAFRLNNPSSGDRHSAVLADRLEQLRFAVRVVAKEARLQGSRPLNIALISPTAADDRPELDRLFRDLLAPELESVHTDLSSTPWHFAAQPPLRAAPVLAAALDLLQWTTRPLPLERIGQLLLSPFVDHADPLENRARFEAHTLRRAPILRPALDLATFLPLLRHLSTANAGRQVRFPELRSLSRAADLAEVHTARRSHAQWADAARKLLHAAGWPGTRALSPAEFRAGEAWERLLDLLSTLQFQGGRLTFSAFLELLTAEANTFPGPAGNLAAPVQVLSLSETEGLPFDLTVVLDATGKHLPPVPRRNPLLPQNLQRKLGFGEVAHSLAQTRTALENLAQRSGRMLLLAPAVADDAPAQLTPLAAQLGFRPADPPRLLPAELPIAPWLTEALPSPETLPQLQDVEVKGGADVLKLQAACGFRAFAARRLAGDDPPPRDLGLNVLDAGTLLHKALEVFWARVVSQAALKALSKQARRDRISDAVDAALAHLRPYPEAGDVWSAHFLRILKERYVKLLLRWLEKEADRSPFTVLAREEQQTLTLGPIRLKLRPDRIDEVDGGVVFVDYKTSYDLHMNHWTDRRPEAPQLPAYALSADPGTLKGIAFAQIRPGTKTFGWISLVQQPGIFGTKRTRPVDMHDQVDCWRTELTSLAEDFAAGTATVDPKSYPKTCKFCAFRTLCRLDPANLGTLPDPEEDLDEDEETDG